MSNDFTLDELQEIFYELLDNLKKLELKNKGLKMKNQCLIKEEEEISKEKMILMQENKNLKKKKLIN